MSQATQQPQIRTIYLAIWTNGKQPAHWAIFVPTIGGDQQGKLLHVTGNTATGFFLEFKRNYDFKETSTRYQIVPLAKISETYVRDTVGDELLSQDTTARDQLESAALSVTPPPRATNPFDKQALNCQNWIEDYIEKLISSGYIDVSARQVLQGAAKYM